MTNPERCTIEELEQAIEIKMTYSNLCFHILRYSPPQILSVNTYNLGVPTPLILGLCEALPSDAGLSQPACNNIFVTMR